MRTPQIALFALMGAALLATHADATWKPEYANTDPAIKSWFQSQKSANGVCCDQADGIIEGTRGFTEWRKTGDGFMVVIQGKAIPVPFSAVTDYTHEGNPNDGAVVWPYYMDVEGIEQPYAVRCFTPGFSS